MRMTDHAAQRGEMLEQHIAARGVRSPLGAIESPRGPQPGE